MTMKIPFTRSHLRNLGLLAGLLPLVAGAQITLTGTSYTENFDAIGSGLPTGWTVRTGATASALGSNATYASATTPWATTTGNFRNAASADGMTGTENNATQNASTDRALAVRQTGTFGDPNAAFVLEIDNTVGLTDFNLTFKLQSLDQTTPRTTTWRVDYGFGATPTSFTAVTTTPATITTGGNAFTNQSVSVNFSNALNNQSGPVWIRVATIVASSGSGNRPTTGIDDFVLSWNAPAVANTTVAFVNTTGQVGEGAGSTNLALAITNPDASNATSVTIGASGATGRITGYSATVTFPAGSGANENVVVTLNDDALCNGNEDVTFTITGISGGSGTPFIGGNNTYVLTVEDDESPVDPTATAATNVDDNSFTANWDAVSGATGYYLDVSTSPTFGGAGTHLAGWDFADSDQTADSGTPANAGQMITANTGAAYTYPGGANIAISTVDWNNGANAKWWLIELSSFGFSDLTLSSKQQSSNTGPKDFKVQYSIDGGATWTDVPGSAVTVANNMTTGVLNDLPLPAACDNQSSLKLRWIMTSNTSVGNATVVNTGTSRIDDISVDAASSSSFVPGYNNLFVNGTSENVTGLNAATTYYYRVRSAGGCSTGNNSNTINVTTTMGMSPVLTLGAGLSGFGDLCLNASSIPQSFTVSGANLTGNDVTVSALAGFTFSTSEFGTYSSSLAIPQPGGSFSQDIWVIFTPTAAQSYDDDIVVGGGGAADLLVAVTGSGINTAPTVSSGSASGITSNGATVAGSIDDEGCSAATAYGIEYSTTQGFTPGTGTQVAASNLANGDFSSTLTGLATCTTYYFRAYATNNGGTTYGSEDTFETAPLGAPLATAATAVLTDGFTANWNAVAGATGYFLDVSTSPTFGTTLTPGATTTETFAAVGGGITGSYLTRSWTGVDGVEWTAYKARTDMEINTGDEAITLRNETNSYLESGEIEGGVGHISFDVMQMFSGNGGVLTVKVLSGAGFATTTTIGTHPYSSTQSLFDESFTPITGPVKIVVENNALARPAIDNLSFTRAESFIPSFVAGYEDLAVAGTSHNVTGLNSSTTYYYRIRAVAASCASDNSNTMSVTTAACAGNTVVVRIATDNNPGDISWEILDAANNTLAFGTPSTANATNQETVCLSAAAGPAWYGFRLYDNFGDGITGGGWELRTVGGKLILRDNFDGGYISPATPASPAYGSAHSFALPLGPADIAANECNIFDNLLGNKVYCNKVTGAANYQFEFSDPDAGFIRRIARPYNYVAFGDMVTNPLTPGVKYFARVRTDKNGPMASAHWGSGCEMGISTQVLGCSGLIQAPAYGHSCNETRSFNTNNSFIYAKPVVGGTEYQFRIYNTGEGYDETFTRSTYILQLKWNSNVAPPLVNGYTYLVEINVKVNGVWSGFCTANVCSITISNPGNRMTEVAMGEATLWPNPVRDGQVNLNIEGITAADQHITVDVTDIYGQHVYGQEFGNSGDRFNTVLSLPGDIATGMYLVNITINGEVTTKRLSIVR